MNSIDILVKSIPLQLAVAQQSSQFSCDLDNDMECEPENTKEGWCSDNIDNDLDNKVDSNDKDCASQSGDQEPVANAGPDQTVGTGQEVLLDGTASYDPENKLISSEWEQTGGPTVQLSNADTLQPTFSAPSEEESKDLTFKLVVNDGEGPSKPDTVTVTVKPTLVGGTQSGDQEPVANAGPDQTVGTGQEVLLDGTASYDPENKLISSEWEQTGGPTVQLSNADTLQPTFSAPSEEESKDLTFKLVVNDGEGPSKPDTVTVIVKPTLPYTQPTPNQPVPDTQPTPNQPDPLSQVEATADQLGHTFDSTLSQVSDPVSLLKQNDLSRLVPLAGLGIVAIAGTVAYGKHRSRKSQHKGSNVAVITRGGIE